MGLRAILRWDLSGKLKSRINTYKKNRAFSFDHRVVRIHVTWWEYNDEYSVTASAYCNDPSAGGFDSRPIDFFYKSQLFRSEAEAEAHVETEVRRASRKHRKTKFIRSREDDSGVIEEEYSKGRWTPIDATGFQNRCDGCGKETEEPICPYCGEMTI